MHGHRKDFFQGETLGDFPQFFQRGKYGELWFLPLKTKKTAFFCWKFQNPWGASPTSPLPTPMYWCLSLGLLSYSFLFLTLTFEFYVLQQKISNWNRWYDAKGLIDNLETMLIQHFCRFNAVLHLFDSSFILKFWLSLNGLL